jgi:hypothetical protein
MKIMAIASPKAALTPEILAPHMGAEVPHTLRLYLDGVVEQFWFRERNGPIFLMNVESVEQARATLEAMPMVKAKLIAYELMPVGPLMPLGRLIKEQ